MKEFNSPDIIATFNNMQMELTLFGKTKVKPEDVFVSYKKLQFKNEYYACLEVEFKFRTAPQSVRATGGATHYAHTGVTDVYFRAYALSKEELDEIEKQEVFEDMSLVEHFTDVSLEALQNDLEYFLEPEPKKEDQFKKKGKLEIPSPIKGLKEVFGPLFTMRRTASKYQELQIRNFAQEKATTLCLTAYDVFKKAHSMVTW